MQPSDQIKAKLNVLEVIKEYIQVKQAGTNWRALCPFHREKSPSFMISPEKGIWHCFGCGKGGDVFAFVMEIEGIGFPEALKMLAQKAGVKLLAGDPKMASKKNRLLDIVDFSRRYFHKLLLDSRAAEPARKYLEERGLKDETIEEWQIGYAPDSWDQLLGFLKQKGFKEDEIFLAGMSIKRERMSGYYNRFRNRIMFPINDVNVQTIGFSGRVMPGGDDKLGKYINSPQSDVYDKSRVVFGLDKAKTVIKHEDLAIIVEGQMDVITAHQAGFRNVVASSGTALTVEQLSLLKRYSQNIALAFDMDQAGEMAAERGIKAALQLDMNIKIIEVPNGKDPDECIKSDPEAFREAVQKARPMMEYFMDKNLENVDRNDIDKLERAVKKIMNLILDLNSKIKQDFWIGKLSGRIGREEKFLKEEIIKLSRLKNIEPKYQERRADSNPILPKKETSREERTSERLLELIIRFPEILDLTANRLELDQIVGQGNRALYKNFVIFYNNNNESDLISGRDEASSAFNYENFRGWVEAFPAGPEKVFLLKALERLVLLSGNDLPDYEYEQARKEALEIVLILKKNYLLLRMKELEDLIGEAEKKTDKATADLLAKEFKLLTDELRNLN